ncbi:putative RhoGAP group protein [Lasiosphaeria hispida]|uniref:RhoGAP group protein n=1 Tax=Lasiosphaeria hispida TaxID=260671 RepID=A0AAJ0MLC8_9PEZI|nr:putative RhoGAP group protein [Lasiosphaeria hispida]
MALVLAEISNLPPSRLFLLDRHITMAIPPVDGMDWISINTCCFAVGTAIAKTSVALNQFVREVRESRSDLDDIASVLHSLDAVLDLLKDDAAAFPPQLARITPGVLESCRTIVEELEGCISVLGRAGVSRADKKSRWLASRDHIEKLRGALAGYNSTLGLAVDLIALTNLRDRDGRGSGESISNESDEKSELTRVAALISQTTTQLQKEARQNGAFAALGRYLDVLHTHAVSAVYLELDRIGAYRRDNSSVGEAPDSAIEMSYDEAAFSPPKHTRSPSTPYTNIPVNEMDELLDELSEMPTRPPTPPPRSRARAGSVPARIVTDRRPSTSDTSKPLPLLLDGYGQVTPRKVLKKGSHQRGWSFSTEADTAHISQPFTSDTNELGLRPPSNNSRPDSQMGRALVQMRNSFWENPRADMPIPNRLSTSSSSAPSSRPNHPDMLRRTNSRLSTAFRSFSLRRKSEAPTAAESPADLEPLAIFGVPISQSLLVARGLGGTQHNGGGSSSREYPLCVLRCVYFIRERGISAPDIFGQEGDAEQLAQLKGIFDSVETGYGKELDWSRFSVYEAADLILLFLSELPAPIISETVAKRWIVLSRQATISGSLSVRLDQGLDFWEEAFAGLKGASRDLFKLLLNLWGDIADAADENDMTAERLAGRVLKSLMHVPAARYDTDFLLSLAFMIRKRSEYNMGMKGRRSNAAF